MINDASSMMTKMIFIVGSSRSGTTMMSRILDRHNDVFRFNELHYFEQIWDPDQTGGHLSQDRAREHFARLLAIQQEGYFAQADFRPYLHEAELMLEQKPAGLTGWDVFAQFLRYEIERNDARIACDHTPRNVYYIPQILASYPNALILAMVRDPRAVLASQKSKWRRRRLSGGHIPMRESIRAWANYHPITISMIWSSAVEMQLKMAGHARVRIVRFEDFVLNPVSELENICRFLQLELEPKMLDVPQIGSSLTVDQPERTGINPQVAHRWREGGINNEELFLIQSITSNQMSTLDYQRESIKPNPLGLFFILVQWPVKTLLAFILNLGRMRNPFAAVIRRVIN